MSTVTTTADFTDAAPALRWGKLFETGVYADKSFAMTADELASAVAAFEPVPVDLEHTPTMLSGKLGTLKQVKLADDGTTLLGGVEEPAWLTEVLGDMPRKVSCTWERGSKKLMGLAYTLNPRVPDAALMAAFSNYTVNRHDTSDGQSTIQRMHDLAAKSGAVCDQSNPNGTSKYTSAYFNSAHENQAMQTMHDTAIQHGAKCADMAADFSLTPAMFAGKRHSQSDQDAIQSVHDHIVTLGADCTPAKMSKEKSPMSEVKKDTTPFESFVAWLKGEQPAEFATTQVTPTITVTSAQPDPEVARLKAENAALRKTQLAADAVAFANGEITAKRAYPAERDAMIAAFTQAASDDANHGTVTFSDGSVKSRVDVLTAAYAVRVPHALTEEVIKTTEVVELSTTSDADAKAKQEYENFMNKTDLGKTAIAS